MDGLLGVQRDRSLGITSIGLPYRRRGIFVVVVVVVILTLTGTLRPVRVGTRTVRVLVVVRRLVDMAYLSLPLEPPLPLALSTTVVFG